MSECLFCQIVDGEVPSHTVFEDDAVKAFLDVNPLTRGHTLIIPKRHADRVDDLTAADAGAIGRAIARVAPAVEAAVDAPASTIAYNNGREAGQEIDHVHAHVVPRFPDDGGGSFHSLFRQRPDLDDDELAAIAEAIDTEE